MSSFGRGTGLNRKVQAGGALALSIGFLLFMTTRSQASGGLDLPQMAIVLIVIGAILLALGALAGWLV